MSESALDVAKAAFNDPNFRNLNADGGPCGAENPDVPGMFCEVPAARCFDFHQVVFYDTALGPQSTRWNNPRQPPSRNGNHSAAMGMADRVEGATTGPVAPLANPSRPDAQVRSNPHQTEVTAAVLSAQKNGTWRRKVLDAIYAAGDRGMIDYDIHTEIGLIEPRVASRRGELEKDGWVESAGITRKTGTGSDAIVWVMSARGLAQYGSLD